MMKNVDSYLIHIMFIIFLLMMAIMVNIYLERHKASSKIIGDAIQFSQQYNGKE